MTTAELRAAAERLRRITNWDSPLDVYGGPDYGHDYSEDVTAIVRDYLAKHPADDDEPIGTSFKRIEIDAEHGFDLSIQKAKDGMRCILESDCDAGISLPPTIKTRGQLRRLVAALKGK